MSMFHHPTFIKSISQSMNEKNKEQEAWETMA